MYSNDYFYPILVLSIFTLFSLKYLGVFEYLKIIFISRKKKWILKNYYEKHFYYYNQLSDKEKERFIIRAYILINKIQITGRQDFKITLR